MFASAITLYRRFSKEYGMILMFFEQVYKSLKINKIRALRDFLGQHAGFFGTTSA